MPIEYSPKGLQFLLKASYAEKRFGNKDGQAICQNCNWQSESDQSGKSLFDIYGEASKHQTEYPDHEIKVSEDICGTISVGSPLRRSD